MAPLRSRIALLFVVLATVSFRASAQQAPQSGGAALIEIENDVTAKRGPGAWQKAALNSPLAPGDKVKTGRKSRAAVRLQDRSVWRLDQLSIFEVAPTAVEIKQGAGYMFNREKDQEMRVNTPAANGALRGTMLLVRVTPALTTLMTVFEGQVELSNAQGSVTLNSGEQGEVEFGRAPRKTAVIDAANILQWVLYYPAVLDPRELAMSAGEERAVAASLAAYRAGDLLGALEKYPTKYQPRSTAARLYHAGVLLAVGRVDDAQAAMSALSPKAPGRRALEQMIAAVKFQDWSGVDEPETAGEWLARSYYLQSKSDLVAARDAARKATDLSPEFGYAWVRVAELEFSFGRIPQALEALKRGLDLTPRNAQGHALRGFLLSAQNRIGEARAAFDEAIALDGALANAWLGRGLTRIRQGDDEAGRQDLQVAATLEPNRSILYSYSGKAFGQVGDAKSAREDLARAKELDPKDPTPWLYSALQNKQENRYNEAIAELEKSIELNENRRVYRSQFLLDQDRGVRGANLAAIYRNNGMIDVSVREAIQAVNADYASASAHLFLANSFDALRDPRRILLRYETAWSNELLLSHLLSPVGGGSLSQFVSQQEYSKLFESDGLGVSSLTDYYSYGELRQLASQYGTFGNISYALDADYLYNNGLRPNNEISRFDSSASFKLQITPQDTVFFQVTYSDVQTGDVFQRFDDDEVGRETSMDVRDPTTGKVTKVVIKNTPALTLDFREQQEPGLVLLGYHHEWDPGIHTLALFGRLANDQVFTRDDTARLIFTRNLGPFSQLDLSNGRSGLNVFESFRGSGNVVGAASLPTNLDYRASFEIYSGELNQIITLGPQTFVLGGRYQKGYFETHALLDGIPAVLQASGFFLDPPSKQDFTVDFERVNLYAYDIWRVAPWLSLTGGVTFDKLRYPQNFRASPVTDNERSFTQTSPKAGFILNPHRTIVLRGAYTEAISGASFDESIRLEPTQIAGFNQAYRTIISEDIAGSIAGAAYKTWGLSLEQKLPTRTYWGIEYNVLTQDLDRTVGVFDFLVADSGQPAPNDLVGLAGLPSQAAQKLVYREDVLTATVNQLIGDRWSAGARFRYSKAKLREDFRDIPRSVFPQGDTTRSSILHELDLFALYNHPSGFFARGEARWFNQENDGFALNATKPRDDPRPGDDFWQLNAIAGWRFYRNQCELSCGVLNITDTDYQLEPLNYYLELPRERTFFVRVKLTF